MATQLEKDVQAVHNLFSGEGEWIQGDFNNGEGGYCLIGGLRKVVRHQHMDCAHGDIPSINEDLLVQNKHGHKLRTCEEDRMRAVEALWVGMLLEKGEASLDNIIFEADQFSPEATMVPLDDVVINFNDKAGRIIEEVENVILCSLNYAKE